MRSRMNRAATIPSARTTGLAGIMAQARDSALWPTFCEWAHRWKARRELHAMSQREIADFCPKVTDAIQEAEKPFWRS
jgi:uncharacterized protein YjiS (DUF1127 family)